MTCQENKQGFLARCRALAAGHGKGVAAYTILFTMALTAVFAFAIGATNELLRERKASQAKAAQQRVILELFGFAEAATADAATLDMMFGGKLAERKDEGGKQTLWYERKNPGTSPSPKVGASGAEVQSDAKEPGSGLFVIPLGGQGFWGPVRGYAALDEKTGKCAGIKFTAHEETPGLGGRIDEKWFTDQFVGMPLLGNPAGARLRLVQGGAKDRAIEADAITGATGTSKAVETLLNRNLDAFAAARKAGGK